MSTTVQVAGAVSLAGTGAAIGVLAYLHTAPTGLSPVRNAVSQYGISSYRWGYRLMTILMGVAGGSLAVALHAGVHGAGVTEVLVLLGVFSLARLAISWFPMDALGAQRTTTGGLHGLLAVATFVAVALAAIRLCRVLQRDAAWTMLGNVSRGLGWAMAVCIGIMLLSRIGPELRRAFGAIERVLYVAIIALARRHGRRVRDRPALRSRARARDSTARCSWRSSTGPSGRIMTCRYPPRPTTASEPC